MKRAAIAAIVILLISGSALGQAKVGTTGPQFLELMPTVRSQATGSQMILFGDANGHFHNPAFLTSRPQHLLALSTIDLPAGVSMYGGAASYGSLSDGSRGFHVGYSLRRLSSGEMVERTYDQGTIEGNGRTFGYDGYEHRLIGAYGFDNDYNLSVGVAVKWIRETVHDYSADGYAFDYGASAHKVFEIDHRISVHPFAAAAYRHIGPDMKLIENEYPLPGQFSLGWGATFAYHGDRLALAEITPVFEFLKPRHDNSRFPVGIEAGIVETAYIRAGDRLNIDSEATWGFGVTTVGIQKQLFGDPHIGDGFIRWLAANLHVAFDYAIPGGILSDDPYSVSIML